MTADSRGVTAANFLAVHAGGSPRHGPRRSRRRCWPPAPPGSWRCHGRCGRAGTGLMSAASPATKPLRRPGTLLRLDRLVSAIRLRKSASAQLAKAASRPPSGGSSRKPDFAVTLVRCDHEAEPVAERKQLAPIRPAASPHRSGCRANRHTAAGCGPRPPAGHCPSPARNCAPGPLATKYGWAPAEQGGSFIDLVERVRADHHGCAGVRGIDHGLRQCKKRFAGPIHRQHTCVAGFTSTP
jgi:hypothetical protein